MKIQRVISLKTPEEIEILHQAGRILASIVAELESSLKSGMTTKDIDLKAEELINLNADESTATTDPFRQSIEEVAEQEMLVPDVERSERFKQMQETAAEYFRLIRAGEDSAHNGQVAALKQKLDELESRYSDDPAYVALLQAERHFADEAGE